MAVDENDIGGCRPGLDSNGVPSGMRLCVILPVPMREEVRFSVY